MGDYVVNSYPYAKFHHDYDYPFPPKYAASFLVLLSAYSRDPYTDFLSLSLPKEGSKNRCFCLKSHFA